MSKLKLPPGLTGTDLAHAIRKHLNYRESHTTWDHVTLIRSGGRQGREHRLTLCLRDPLLPATIDQIFTNLEAVHNLTRAELVDTLFWG